MCERHEGRAGVPRAPAGAVCIPHMSRVAELSRSVLARRVPCAAHVAAAAAAAASRVSEVAYRPTFPARRDDVRASRIIYVRPGACGKRVIACPGGVSEAATATTTSNFASGVARPQGRGCAAARSA